MNEVYIAGKYTSQERLRRERDRLRELGISVSSFWLDEKAKEDWNDGSSMPAPGVASDAKMLENADRDIAEVAHARAIILDTLDVSETGGREAELGVILHRRYRNDCRVYPLIILIGPKRNIFHHKADHVFADWDEFIAHAYVLERN